MSATCSTPSPRCVWRGACRSRASAARCSSATPAQRPTRRRSSSPARRGPGETWWSSTAAFTDAPTERSRRPRRRPSRLPSRRSCPASVRWRPTRRRCARRATGGPPLCRSSRSRAAPACTSSPASCSPRPPGVLPEPIQGETGVHILSGELLAAAREACDEHGAALIFDEVQCGMGRTGSLWAYEQLGVKPDAMTVAKALGGGLPIGALVTGERLSDVLVPGDHGSTFAGGPVIAAAALAALELTDDVQLLERVRVLGQTLAEGAAQLPNVAAVRGRGLMLACELDVAAPAVVQRALLEQRLVLNATGPSTLRVLPPPAVG